MDKTERKIFISFAIILGVVLLFVFSYVVYFSAKYPLKYSDSILLYADEYDIKPELVASVICAESRFDKDAVSKKGAIGLMQIKPSTAVFMAEDISENFDYNTLFESQVNIKIGCMYLDYLFDKFENEEVALASFNAGEGVVKRWLEDPRYSDDKKTLKFIPYKETREYVQKVQKAKGIYKSKLKSWQ